MTTSESRARYRSAMQSSAHFDPLASSSLSLSQQQRSRRTRVSMFLSGSRIDPASFIRNSQAASPSHHQPAHKTSFDGGELIGKEAASLKPRRASLIDPPKAPPGHEEIQPRQGKRISLVEVEAPLSDVVGNTSLRSNPFTITSNEMNQQTTTATPVKNDSLLSLGSSTLMKVQAGNVSQCVASLLSPQRVSDGSIRRSGRLSATQLEETLSPNVRTHVKVNVEANTANHMSTTNIAPARKGSRWSRKKSLEAGKAAFLAMTRPKSYGFQRPPLEEERPRITGNGVAQERHHRRNFAMVVNARQAVNPPWGTDSN